MLSMKLIALLVAMSLFTVGNACIGAGDDGTSGDDGSGDDGSGDDGTVTEAPSATEPPPSDGGQEPDQGDANTREPNALDKIGKGIDDVTQYDNSNYDGNVGTFVASGDELACDFEDAGSCCWGNELDEDDLDFLIIEGEPDPDLWDTFIASDEKPTGSYIVTAASDSPDAVALFMSCGVECAANSVVVNAKAWGTGAAALMACVRSLNDDGTPTEPVPQTCVPFPLGGAGTAEIPLEGNLEKFQVVLVADGFADPELGDLIIVDDIEVLFDECGPSTPDTGDCDSINCNYEGGDLCDDSVPLAEDSGDSSVETMAVHNSEDGPYSNPITGINNHHPDSEGTSFLAGNLTAAKPVTGVVIPFASLEAGQQISYWYYAAANDQIVALCFDDFDVSDLSTCIEDKKAGITPSDRQWIQAAPVDVPEGATKATIVSTYAPGVEIRPTASTAFGLDDIQLLKGGESCK